MTLHVRRTVDNRHQGEVNTLFGRKRRATVATTPLMTAESTGTLAVAVGVGGAPQRADCGPVYGSTGLAAICKESVTQAKPLSW